MQLFSKILSSTHTYIHTALSGGGGLCSSISMRMWSSNSRVIHDRSLACHRKNHQTIEPSFNNQRNITRSHWACPGATLSRTHNCGIFSVSLSLSHSVVLIFLRDGSVCVCVWPWSIYRETICAGRRKVEPWFFLTVTVFVNSFVPDERYHFLRISGDIGHSIWMHTKSGMPDNAICAYLSYQSEPYLYLSTMRWLYILYEV